MSAGLISRMLCAIISRDDGADVIGFYLSDADFDAWRETLRAQERHNPLVSLEPEFGEFLGRPVAEIGFPGPSFIILRTAAGTYAGEITEAAD